MVFGINKLEGWLVTTEYLLKMSFKKIKYFNNLHCFLSQNWIAQLVKVKALTSPILDLSTFI